MVARFFNFVERVRSMYLIVYAMMIFTVCMASSSVRQFISFAYFCIHISICNLHKVIANCKYNDDCPISYGTSVKYDVNLGII